MAGIRLKRYICPLCKEVSHPGCNPRVSHIATQLFFFQSVLLHVELIDEVENIVLDHDRFVNKYAPKRYSWRKEAPCQNQVKRPRNE